MAQVLAHANFNNMFFSRIILVIYYMCLYVLLCDYLPLCVYYLGLVDFCSRIVIQSLLDSMYFGHLASKGKLVILLRILFFKFQWE